MRMDMDMSGLRSGLDVDRHQMHISVPHARLRDQTVGAGAYVGNAAFQDHGFQTVIVIEMHMLGSDGDVMVIVLYLRQPV